jgi:hypothetical protein
MISVTPRPIDPKRQSTFEGWVNPSVGQDMVAPAVIERDLPSRTCRQSYPGFTSSTDILAALNSLTKSPPLQSGHSSSYPANSTIQKKSSVEDATGM